MGNEQSNLVDHNAPTVTLEERNLESVAKLIKDGKIKRIVVMTGAGLSTAAGIPDFRSPETGLYANLGRLNLPSAESVFDIDYFRTNPEPFYVLAKELYPGNYQPTLSHVFISLLAKKGLLAKIFTQNIDCLERQAGVPDDLIVEAHGSFASQRCIDCHTAFPDGPMKEHVLSNRVPHCVAEGCDGLVKPNIVFFGEQLPLKFFQALPLVEEADLALILGTSLAVQPFAMLPERVPDECPRVLFNMERVGRLGTRPDDVLQLGDCDVNICTLAAHLDWLDELNELWRSIVGEEEAERQFERIREVKKKVMAESKKDMDALLEHMRTVDLDDEKEVEKDSSSGGDDSPLPRERTTESLFPENDRPLSRERTPELSSAEGKDTASSGAAVAGSEASLPGPHRAIPAGDPTKPEADGKQQNVDVAHVGEHHKASGVEKPDASDLTITADAEEFLAPVSAPHVNTEKKKTTTTTEETTHESVSAKTDPGPDTEPDRAGASKHANDPSSKPSLS